jgi:hypothetical protein
MAGYTLKANLIVVITLTELNKIFDSDDPTIAWFINLASSMLWSRISGRQDYANEATMKPALYNTTTNPFPILGHHCDMLTIDLGRWRKGAKFLGDDHPSLQWAEDVRMNRADIGSE